MISELIGKLHIDGNDEWQVEDDNTVSVALYPEPFTKTFKDIFGTDLYDYYPEGWIDAYAIIDIHKKAVVEIEINIVTNRYDEKEFYFPIIVNNKTIQEKIFKELDEDTDGRITSWIDTDVIPSIEREE